MHLPESAVGLLSAAGWKTYSVSRADKAPLLRFMTEALEARGCAIVYASPSGRAPFYIVFETPTGERHGILAYAFFANSRVTTNRPENEHRFQMKYGGELRGILEIGIDPHFLITTILVGIDPARGIFVAADPLMNNPAPMSRSIEFKTHHVEEILATGWAAWERPRREPKTKHRPAPVVDEDTRIQVLVGGTKERFLDLVRLERLGRGLDPGDRHLLSDRLSVRTTEEGLPPASHKLLEELSLPPEALFDLIDGASRLKMAVRGWVAETHLVDEFRKLKDVSDCQRIEAEGQPDVTLRWKGGPPILVECKNVLRKQTAGGLARVDFQRTRSSKDDPCSRYYQPDDFAVLAACLHAVTGDWDYSFALTCELPAHPKCPGRISSNVVVAEPTFARAAEMVFDKCSGLV